MNWKVRRFNLIIFRYIEEYLLCEFICEINIYISIIMVYIRCIDSLLYRVEFCEVS